MDSVVAEYSKLGAGSLMLQAACLGPLCLWRGCGLVKAASMVSWVWGGAASFGYAAVSCCALQPTCRRADGLIPDGPVRFGFLGRLLVSSTVLEERTALARLAFATGHCLGSFGFSSGF